MPYPQLLRIWKGSINRGRHRRCGMPIWWAINAKGKSVPLATTAKPIREEIDDRGCRFLIFEPTAYHRCPAKPQPPVRVDAAQESLP